MTIQALIEWLQVQLAAAQKNAEAMLAWDGSGSDYQNLIGRSEAFAKILAKLKGAKL